MAKLDKYSCQDRHLSSDSWCIKHDGAEQCVISGINRLESFIKDGSFLVSALHLDNLETCTGGLVIQASEIYVPKDFDASKSDCEFIGKVIKESNVDKDFCFY